MTTIVGKPKVFEPESEVVLKVKETIMGHPEVKSVTRMSENEFSVELNVPVTEIICDITIKDKKEN